MEIRQYIELYLYPVDNLFQCIFAWYTFLQTHRHTDTQTHIRLYIIYIDRWS